MAFTTTTLNGAIASDSRTILVTSGTGFAAGSFLIIDQEVLKVGQSYLSGTTVPVLRGQNGTKASAHVTGANVTVGTASDFAQPGAQANVTYQVAGRVRTVTSYSRPARLRCRWPGRMRWRFSTARLCWR